MPCCGLEQQQEARLTYDWLSGCSGAICTQDTVWSTVVGQMSYVLRIKSRALQQVWFHLYSGYSLDTVAGQVPSLLRIQFGAQHCSRSVAIYTQDTVWSTALQQVSCHLYSGYSLEHFSRSGDICNMGSTIGLTTIDHDDHKLCT